MMKVITNAVTAVKKLPIVKYIYKKWINPPEPFTGSEDYWISRYDSGGNSGPGSYSKLAEYKAEVINSFVSDNAIETVIEYGCGDGNQLKLTNYPNYLGFDVSPKAILLCRELFENDSTKCFELIRDYNGETAQLTLSLDVIFHLVEDEVFTEYMNRLFDSAESFVMIYSSNGESQTNNEFMHVKHRKFTDWVESNKPEWKLYKHIPNQYPFVDDASIGSFSDFYIYEKA